MEQCFCRELRPRMLGQSHEDLNTITPANAIAFSLRSASWRRRKERNLSTTLRHCRLRFTEQFLLLWMSRVD